MKRSIVFWMLSIIFYIIYFSIFDFTLGNLFPTSGVSNFILLFILIVINIPLSIISTEKLFSIIKEK